MADPEQAQVTGFDRKKLITYPAHMKMLGGTVLNTKKDIKFNRNASYPKGAQRYAAARGWTCQIEDINNDKEDDIVLFDKKGNPVLINGYSLKPSEHKLRQKFFEYPINKRVEYGGYNQYKREMRGNPELEAEMQGWATGYAKLRKPARKREDANPEGTLYKRFCVRVKNILDDYIARRYAAAGDDHPSLVGTLKKIIPYTSVQAYFYVDSLLSTLWDHDMCAAWRQEIVSKTNVPHTRCELFKRVLSKNARIVDTIATPEFLDELVADYTDDALERILSNFGIIHDDIYQEGIIPPDNADLSTPQNKGTIAFHKELISEALLNDKDRMINGIFKD